MMGFALIDRFLEDEDYEPVYLELKKRYDGGEKSLDLLWRLCTAVCEYGMRLGDENAKKRLECINEGVKYGEEAVALDDQCFEALKYYAVAIGNKSSLVGTKEKIQLGHKLKEYLDKALKINPECTVCLHMRGSYSYSVASLSWVERKVASTLFAKVPSATIEEAICDFAAVAEKDPDWIRNNFYYGKALYDKGEKAKAKEAFLKVTSSEATLESERQWQAEAAKISTKC